MFSRRLRCRWIAGSLCASALLFAGCGDFFNKNGGGGGGSVGSYVYVGTQGGVLGSYAVSTTGALSSLSGSPFPLSTAAINALAVTSGNTFLYAGVAGIGVYGLSINSSTGVTTLLNNNAVLVADVSGFAARAGLICGDIITAVNKHRVHSISDFLVAMAGLRDPSVSFSVTRGQQMRIITIERENTARRAS